MSCSLNGKLRNFVKVLYVCIISAHSHLHSRQRLRQRFPMDESTKAGVPTHPKDKPRPTYLQNASMMPPLLTFPTNASALIPPTATVTGKKTSTFSATPSARPSSLRTCSTPPKTTLPSSNLRKEGRPLFNYHIVGIQLYIESISSHIWFPSCKTKTLWPIHHMSP